MHELVESASATADKASLVTLTQGIPPRTAWSRDRLPLPLRNALNQPQLPALNGVRAVSVFLVIFFMMGCATNQSAQKPSEKVIVQLASSEREDALAEKLRSLENSVSSLRSEVAALEKRLSQTQVRPPLYTYKLPRVVSICGEKVPLEDKKVWENLDQEFLLELA